MLQRGRTEILRHHESPKIRCLKLRVLNGPDKGQTWELDAEPVRIGSAAGAEVVLSDASVSGLHAELKRTPHGVLVRDLSSTNGLFVDGRRIVAVYCRDQVRLHLGKTTLELDVAGREVDLALDEGDGDGAGWGDLVGRSVAMRALFAKLRRVSHSDCTVLITGETGTGKELVAASIAEHSSRSQKPFVVVDCASLPPTLMEAELFGHERGAFTGAERRRLGAFERAAGGTLFLDEIGELPLAQQAALLGVLERRQIQRVGGGQAQTIDVRVVAATNRDLAAEVQRGAFRADLYYRLAVVELALPPLRERPDDIPLLVDHFLNQHAGPKPTLSPTMLEHLQQCPWPGNVRELRNVIERAVVLAEAPAVRDEAAQGQQKAVVGGSSGNDVLVDVDQPFKPQKSALVERFERQYIEALLQRTEGNIAQAARVAQIDRMYVYKLISRYDIDVQACKAA